MPCKLDLRDAWRPSLILTPTLRPLSSSLSPAARQDEEHWHSFPRNKERWNPPSIVERFSTFWVASSRPGKSSGTYHQQPMKEVFRGQLQKMFWSVPTGRYVYSPDLGFLCCPFTVNAAWLLSWGWDMGASCTRRLRWPPDATFSFPSNMGQTNGGFGYCIAEKRSLGVCLRRLDGLSNPYISDAERDTQRERERERE